MLLLYNPIGGSGGRGGNGAVCYRIFSCTPSLVLCISFCLCAMIWMVGSLVVMVMMREAQAHVVHTSLSICQSLLTPIHMHICMTFILHPSVAHMHTICNTLIYIWLLTSLLCCSLPFTCVQVAMVVAVVTVRTHTCHSTCINNNVEWLYTCNNK